MKTHRFFTFLTTLALGVTPLMAGNTPTVTGNDENNAFSEAPSPQIFGDLFKTNPKRSLEFNWFWGFNTWGDKTFGFGGTTGDAEVSYYFMNLGFSLDYPLIKSPHFGLYAGLGIEGDLYHFTSHLVSCGNTGFQASATPLAATATPMDPNNWDTYFSTSEIIIPVTFSIEPGDYKDLCIRLSVIPGINTANHLHQQYQSKTLDLEVRDKECSKKVNDFMLDARLALYYRSIGIYAQVATQPLFKSDSGVQELYPVKFGFIWSIGGR